MVYMGSKNKIAKYLLPHILKNRKPNQAYVEPFTGGANMIDKVDGVRIGGELNEYIVAMWLSLLDGWIPRIDYTREEYKFNHDKFYQWCREMVNDNQLFISEYTAPDDFIPVWSKTVNVHLSTKCNSNIEQLFIHESQLENYLYGC